MIRKLTLAGLTGIALLVGCGGDAHKLGGDSQATESSGGSAGTGTGGVAQGGDPSAFGGKAGDGAGGQVGGSVGTGGVIVPPAMDAGFAGAGAGGYTSVGGNPGTGGTTAPPPAGTQPTPGITASGTGGTQGDGFVGNWTGYVENGHFDSGSDALALSVNRVSDTELSGHLVMGQGSGALPDLAAMAGIGGNPGVLPLEGYAYTALNGKVTGPRLEFDVAFDEPYASVCSAQTPISGSYSCLPPADSYSAQSGHCYGYHGGTPQEMDCTTFALCSGGLCKCDATGCFADLSMWTAHFDMTLRSPYLDGSALGGPFNPNNVHFTPQ